MENRQSDENRTENAPEGRDKATGRFTAGNKGGGRPAVSRRLRELCQQHADEAIAGLLNEARNADSPSARIAAWTAILDRGFGKPTVGEPDDNGQQGGSLMLRWLKPGEGDENA